MLQQLDIRNFAIIDDLSLELRGGLTVLTGETGAGKSILLDALGLLLGDRAESDSIRGGAEKAEISAEFQLADAPAAREWLRAHDFDVGADAQTCLVRRVVAADGRGRAYINSSPASARDLRELGELLVDIHGQHEHQSLLRREAQRSLLDNFGGHTDLADRVAQLARQHQDISTRIDALAQRGDDGGMRVDFLRFQVNELEALGLQPGELEQLDVEHKRLSNAGRLIEQGQQAQSLLYESEEGSIYDRLSEAHHLLADLGQLDPALAEAAELTSAAQVQVKEAADAVRHALGGLDLDPQRLQQLENRLADIHNQARKHRVTPADLPGHLDSLRAELSNLEGASVEVDKLEKEKEAVAKSYEVEAGKLGSARDKAAKKVSSRVTEVMRGLGMPQGSFAVTVQRTALENARLPVSGLDQIEFLVNANPGQEARPLSKVASGGELSRISLAIQVIAAKAAPVPTLVFDEVDAGIGGGVAEIVGRQLRVLGAERQVLCVTHLAQVAAQAQHQLQVRKEVKKNETYTRVQPLADVERVEELARMLGGLDITAQTRAHAREMMKRAAAKQPA